MNSISKTLMVLVFMAGCFSTNVADAISKEYSKSSPEKALLIIDIQEDCTGTILKPPFLYQKKSAAFITKVNQIIEAANNHNVLVVYIRTNAKLQELPGAQLDARLKVVNNNCFLKDSFDVFSASNHQFADLLKGKSRVKENYIVGLDATICVYETAKGAVNHGYKTTILKDAVLTISGKSMAEIIVNYVQNGILVANSDVFIHQLH